MVDKQTSQLRDKEKSNKELEENVKNQASQLCAKENTNNDLKSELRQIGSESVVTLTEHKSTSLNIGESVLCIIKSNR